MKVKGNLNSILSNHRLYVKLTLAKNREDERVIKDNFIKSFFSDDRKYVKEQIEELLKEKEKLQHKVEENYKKRDDYKSRKLEQRKRELENEKEYSDDELTQLEKRNGELEERNYIREHEYESLERRNRRLEERKNFASEEYTETEERNVETEDTSSPSAFLSMVKAKSQSKVEEKEEVFTEEVNIIHGIYIDEYVKSPDSGVSNNSFDDDNTPEKEEKVETETEVGSLNIIHGVYIDEYIKTEKVEDKVQEEEPEEPQEVEQSVVTPSNEIVHGLYIDEYEKGKLTPIEKPKVQEKESKEVVKEVEKPKESELKAEVKDSETNEEIIIVPPNIRDFIKANQGCTESYVLKYYDKKTLAKAVGLGKIYVKKGKLYT